MSRLNDLLRQLETSNPALAKDLRREVDALSNRRAFGLNFERHVPEVVELPGRTARRGDKVRLLPPRGGTDASSSDHRLWRVVATHKDSKGNRLASLETLAVCAETAEAPVEELVVVAEFRDPIYPGLISTGKVERGGDKPYHALINAENYHALQTLLFTHRGMVDAIYIDPPYNTGARDWKYNNDYVEGEDHYRHSKWLAFMERRLKLARELLNPEDSVLIVTIDEKEYLRLGLLLEQTFPEAIQQMVTIVMSSFGSPRAQALDRVDEYAYFLYFGEASPARVFDDLLGNVVDDRVEPVRWESLLRSGSGFRRADRPNLFYPVFIDKTTGGFAGFGDSKPVSARRSDWTVPAGCGAFWPTRKDGSDGRWQVSQSTMQELFENGFAKVGGVDLTAGRGSVYYLTKAQRQAVQSGDIRVIGRDDQGALVVEHAGSKRTTAKSVWNRPAHAANLHGTSMVKALLGGREFPYPKSLYAVEDALRLATLHKPEAVIVDFFAGSGTTAHAVMRLNKQDGGRRRSISVTNNEVGAAEQKRLKEEGLRPGDANWEKWGICDYITKPRITAAITGMNPANEPISGEYKYTDEFPLAQGFEENFEFFTLTYKDPLRVSSNREFAAIAPLLWLSAGSEGRRIEDISKGWDVADAYGVLADLNQSEAFIEAISTADGIRMTFIVTDEDRLFESIVRELPDHVEPVRMYESYLQNFEIHTARSAL